MNSVVISLVKPCDAALSLSDAKHWIGAPARPSLATVLSSWGLSGCVFGDAEPTVADAPPDVWPYDFVRSDGRRLQILVPDLLLEVACSLRFGGTGRSTSGARRSSVVKARFGERVARAVVSDLPGAAWTPTDVDAQTTEHVAFSVALECESLGDCSIILALASPGAVAGSPGLHDEGWQARLRALAGEVRLPVRAVIARPVISAGEVARLAVGDVLPIRAPDRATLLTGKRRLADGLLTEVDGHAGVVIGGELQEYA